MKYKSTRGNAESIGSAQAILQGLAGDKGLYVPVDFPTLDVKLSEIAEMDYKEVAFYILKKYLEDYTEQELKDAIEKAYDEKFETSEIAPLAKEKDVYFLELYHGKTLAFKDMALSILPHLLTTAAKKMGENKKIVILAATSGDTGKAALEGFADVENTEVIIFYPEKGVSEIQKRQMTTQEGKNTHTIAIKGNFDDAQRGVKEIFNDGAFNREMNESNHIFSSANSINIGRLVPQVVYYVYTYGQLLKRGEIKEGETINFVVPTGNFGNILAGYYAKKMGLPINKLICASNENNVLYDFINSGIYDINRKFIITNSPSMDILISSNLERLLYELSEGDEGLINRIMGQLETENKYEITPKMKENLKGFYGGYTTDEQTLETIKRVYNESKYVMDTHTAVAYKVYEQYKEETKDTSKTVIVSTASPYKFTKSVIGALSETNEGKDEFELIKVLSEHTGLQIPTPIKDLDKKEILHRTVCEKQDMKATIKEMLHI
ncbi:threonine synthase [Clostridium formicaceticum]|uniref:Threonine synthase n=1 Tax=Clostridium formicaceticum TaxID=1497 RepID=A0ABM6EYT4_9CLOT|nr:threonine synthase [Clostridium formicaceticum]AOY78175.1 threonine synthase [Clostridium formicaceticum]